MTARGEKAGGGKTSVRTRRLRRRFLTEPLIGIGCKAQTGLPPGKDLPGSGASESTLFAPTDKP